MSAKSDQTFLDEILINGNELMMASYLCPFLPIFFVQVWYNPCRIRKNLLSSTLAAAYGWPSVVWALLGNGELGRD